MRIDPNTHTSLFTQLPARPVGGTPFVPQTEPAKTGESPFLARLKQAVREVSELQRAADLQAEQLATGDAVNLEQALIAMEKADLALQLTVQVTQRAVDAYREISRMQV